MLVAVRHLVLCALASILIACSSERPPVTASGTADVTAVDALPEAAVRNVAESFFGVEVDDPYRWLEDTTDPEAAAWMRAHSDHANGVLQSITGRDQLRARLDELENATAARVADVQRRLGERYFFLRRGADEDQFKLYVQQGFDGEARLLFDPERLSQEAEGPHAINYYSASPNGRLVALGVSAGGSEDAALRVLDVSTGEQRGPVIERAQFGAVSWSPDGEEIYFHRMQALTPGQPSIDKYRASEAVVMAPGADESDIRVLVRAGCDLDIPDTQFPLTLIQPDGRVLLYVVDGVSPQAAIWHSTLTALRNGEPEWEPLVSADDGVTSLVVQGDTVIARSFDNAPRFRLVSGPLAGFRMESARDLIPETEQVLTDFDLAADALYFTRRDGNVQRLYRLALDGSEPQEIELPVLGSLSLSIERDLPGAMLSLQSWTRARQIYALAPDGSISNTGLQPSGLYDQLEDFMATEVMVSSHDGVQVPMSILHRRDIELDGSHPTMLYAYASYGFTEEPVFSVLNLAWLEAGGVLAVANPRGSGVFGRDWHLAGKLANKPNSWKDLNTCAEYLIEQGWTRPARLAVRGGSAGGLLVGRAMTARPDLYAAVVPMVGALDMIRMETTPNGVPNIPEFGTRAEEVGFRALLEMSTYHQIRDGVAYPAVLLTHGVNDPRVEVWHTTKAAARLMAATSSPRPVLMRLDYASGHGIGNTRSQLFDERADIYAFLLWQLGVPGWQPSP